MNLIRKQERLAHSLGISPKDYQPIQLHNPTEWIGNALWGVFIGLLLAFHLCFALVRVSGPSMQPTLQDKQFMLLARHHSVHRFDVVVLRERTEDGGESKQIVKRVIGLPGDHVQVTQGRLFINGEVYAEPYLDPANIHQFTTDDFELQVPEDHYFVMGDNRDISKDSRSVGSFVRSAVVGVQIR